LKSVAQNEWKKHPGKRRSKTGKRRSGKGRSKTGKDVVIQERTL
jgi:hypothetical protein